MKDGKKYYDHRLTRIEKTRLIDEINQSAEGFTTAGDAPLPPYSAGKDKRLQSLLQTNASKVVDENGEPLVVYHGGASGRTQFEGVERGRLVFTSDRLAVSESYSGVKGETGISGVDESQVPEWAKQRYSSPARLKAAMEREGYKLQEHLRGKEIIFPDGQRIELGDFDEWTQYSLDDVVYKVRRAFSASSANYPLYLDMKHPLIVDAKGRGWDNISYDGRRWYTNELAGWAEQHGYDGLVLRNIHDAHTETGGVEGSTTTDYIAFHPEQVKSATDNVGTFSSENPDIRYQFLGEQGAGRLDAAQERTERLDALSVAREVEARNVEKRRGMSAEERRRTLAAETEDVAREDQIFLRGEGGASESRAEAEEEDVEATSKRFDEELQQQIDGKQEKGHVYRLGRPGAILRSTGVPDVPIELSASHLSTKANAAHHPFNMAEMKGLVKALQSPIAVFSYGDKGKAQNAIVEIQHEGKNFVVGVHFNQKRGNAEVSSIRGLYPKDNAEWLNWLTQGKALYVDKEKIQTLIDQQRRNLADVDYLDLDSAAKVVKEFENPALPGGEKSKASDLYREGDADSSAEAAKAEAAAPAAKRSAAEHLSGQLHTPLRIVEDVSEITHADAKVQRRRRGAKGWYDTRTGEVVIVLPNNADAADVASTSSWRKLYDAVLAGDFNDVTLQLIQDYLEHVTPNNPYGRPLSRRLPARVQRSVRSGEPANGVDALFTRISESAVGLAGKSVAERRSAVKAKKEALLEARAKAAGRWHTDVRAVSSYGVNALIDFAQRWRRLGKGKKTRFPFTFHSACTTFDFAQRWRRLGKGKKTRFPFTFHSACTTFGFAQRRRRLGKGKKTRFPFTFHSACTTFAAFCHLWPGAPHGS